MLNPFLGPRTRQSPHTYIQAFAAGADIKEMASKSFVEAFSTNMFHQVRFLKSPTDFPDPRP